MPTTDYIHKPDNYLTLTFRLTYSLDERGGFGAIERINMMYLTLRAGDGSCCTMHLALLPFAFTNWWESHVECLYGYEIVECIEEAIKAAKVAEGERRRDMEDGR